MNKILSTILAAFVLVPFGTATLAADTGKPVIPAPPVVAAQPAVDSAAHTKKPVTPRKKKHTVTKAAPALEPKEENTPNDEATAAQKAIKLKVRQTKAQENTKALKSNPAKEAAPAAK